MIRSKLEIEGYIWTKLEIEGYDSKLETEGYDLD